MKTKILGDAVGHCSIIRSLCAACSLLIVIASGPANAATTTYTDSAAYFAAVGPQTFEDFNSPISTTANSGTYQHLTYVCSGGPCGIGSDGQSGLSAFYTSGGIAIFSFDSPIRSFGISIFGLGTFNNTPNTLTITASNGFSANLITDFLDPTCAHCSLATAIFGGLVSDQSFDTVVLQGKLPCCDGVNFDNLYYGHSSVITTPLPAALPLFATGLGVLGLLGWRRKRKGSKRPPNQNT